MHIKNIFLVAGSLFFRMPAFGQDLSVAPAELIYSGTQDQTSAHQTITIRNNGSRSRAIRNVSIVGIDADAFRLAGALNLPIRLEPKESAEIPVQFAPNGEIGFMNATLQVNGANIKRNASTKLYGLSAEGLEGEKEPSLHYIVLTLGHAVEVGSASLRLGTDAEMIGEEISSPSFVKAGKGNVTLVPVARYSPAEPVPFGYYRIQNEMPQQKEIGILSGEGQQHQTLLPTLASGSTTFDPGNEAFGLYTATKSHHTYTEDRLNTGETKHAVRVYPLRDRRGNLMEDKYLVCFEEAANGDYQDFVFILSNVKPAFMAD